MYPTLRENQGLAHQATSNHSNHASTSSAEMNGHPNGAAPPVAYTQPSHHASSSRSRRPASGFSPSYFNAAYYHNSSAHQKVYPSSLPARYLSHVYYASAAVDYDGTVRLSEENTDLHMTIDGHKGAIQACLALKQKNPNLRFLLSVGGRDNSASYPFAGEQTFRHTFASSVKVLVDKYGFNGAEVDWQTPENPEQGHQLIELLAYVRGFLPAQYGYTVAVKLPGVQTSLEYLGDEIDQVEHFADIINLRTYDFAGKDVPQTAHHAQMLAETLPGSSPSAPSCQAAVNYLQHKGVKMSHVHLGIPCYGRVYTGATGPKQKYTEAKDVWYREIPYPGPHEEVDRIVKAAHCTDNNMWVSFDNPETVHDKGKFVKLQGLGGLFYCDAAGDKQSPATSLILAGNESLRGG